MKKLILASIILLISEFAIAQRFFQGFEVVPYLYTDNVYYGARELEICLSKNLVSHNRRALILCQIHARMGAWM
jgi:hypothetical protein